MSRKKSRMEDLRAAKDARMKKIAIGGAVLLVLVLAYEVPKMMHKSSASSAPPPAATTTTPDTGTATPVTPTPTAAPASLPAESTQLATSDLPPTRSKSQLLSFSHFSGKDPFVQQVQDSTLGSSGVTNQPAGGNGNSSAPANITSAKVAKGSASSVRTLAATGDVKIEVNGQIETVRVGGSFPSSNPLFKLVSIATGAVRIGIANGSYASGAHAVALTPGRTLTLVDTADGIRYKIRLITAA
jgi:hypothetical protein